MFPRGDNPQYHPKQGQYLYNVLREKELHRDDKNLNDIKQKRIASGLELRQIAELITGLTVNWLYIYKRTMRSEYQKLIWGNIQFFKSNMSPLKAVVGLEEEGVLSKDEARQVLNAAIDNEGQIEALFSLLCEKEGNASYVKLVKVLKKRHQKRIADALTTGVEHLIEEDEDNMMTMKNTEPTTQQRGRPTQKLKADSLVRQLAATAHDKVELLGKLEEKDQEVDRLGKELRNKHDDILWMRAELDKRRQSVDELEEARQKTIRNAKREDTRDVDKIVEDMKTRLKQKDEEISFVIDHIAALTETVNRLALEKEQKSPQVRRKRDRSPLPDIVVFEPNDD